MKIGKSDLIPTYELNAILEEDPKSEWSCRLEVKRAQSKMELSIEVRRSGAKKNSEEKISHIYYDIYQSRLQPARRNENAQTLRVELMLVSRTQLPYATFHTLGRINVSQEAVAKWLTNSVSESLQKILKKGFDGNRESESQPHVKIGIKEKLNSSSTDAAARSSEFDEVEDADSDSDSEALNLIN
jgi:hypothetical protein